MSRTPGIFVGMDEAEYRADEALSHSGAKLLLPPGCPALYKYTQEHPRPDKKAFDIGHAVHHLVLGTGPPLFTVDAEDWRSTAARKQRDEIRGKGGVPLLAHEMAEIEAMADAVHSHPLAGPLFSDGTPEVSCFWDDERTGVPLRMRLDWLPNPHYGRMILADLKTAESAERHAFGRQVASYRYYTQPAWYMDGLHALGTPADITWLFVVVEKHPPYLVNVLDLRIEDIRAGRDRNRAAIELFARCVEKDEWPGYGNGDIDRAIVPNWIHYERDEEPA